MSIPENFTLFIFILARITGCIIFNQIFGRGNVPIIFQVGLSIMLSITVYGIIPMDNTIEIDLVIVYILMLAKELFLGFLIGHIIRLFMSVVVIAGDVLDLQMGLSMAKIYDPKSQISMGLTGSLLNIMFMLIFFCAGGHMTLIRIFIKSFEILPIGKMTIGTEVLKYAADLLIQIFIYSIKVTLPIMAVELITEVGMGIMTKAIPQIQMFVINIPLKIILGLASIMILVPTYSAFLEKLITLMFESIEKGITLLM